jgi:hypothetical protein
VLRPRSIEAKPDDFPAFSDLNPFDQLDLELPDRRENLDRRLTGLRCTIREWLESPAGEAWISDYQRRFHVLPDLLKMAKLGAS